MFASVLVQVGEGMVEDKVGIPVLRKPAKSLNTRMVNTTTTPGKYFDGHGLYLRVDPGGARYWVQRIVIKGKRCELGLGSPDFVSLADARIAAFENRRVARSGGDPLAGRREKKAVMTFEEAAREVHRINLPTWKNSKHGDQFINTLATYVFPTMGKIKAPDVTSGDILAVLQPIWLTKAETARRVKQRIGTVMKWCIAQGWRRDNPADTVDNGLPKQTDKTVHRKALPYEEIAGCLEVIDKARAGISTKLCLELVILTCVRSSEAREAKWPEFDLKAKVWEIPADRMKMKRPHRVPLSDRAVAVLKRAQGLDDELVFPGTRRGKPLSDATLLKLIRENGFAVDIHGFRTSFRTWAQERTNFPREVAEAVLAHLSGDAVERAYARSDLFDKRRKMMDAWAAYLAEKPGKIVRIG